MSAETFLLFLFWCSLALVAYTFVGYPVLMYFAAKLFGRQGTASEMRTMPTVSVVLAAHNEEARIARRLENLLSADYPKDKLEIIVVSDGSTDGTAVIVQSLQNPRVQLIEQPIRSGKAACLNTGVSAAKGEIIVFGDLRQRFAANTIPQLASHFADPAVVAVSGSLEIETAESAIGGGVDAYWRLEKFLRHSESKLESCVGCTGAVYAIRRSAFRPIPPDTLLDDVVIPMQVAVQGLRVLFDPAAVAYDPQTLEPEREKVRKQRTLAGNYQMLFRYPGWLLPWKNRLWWQLLSHKYLRLAAPMFMIAMMLANAALADLPFYRLLFGGQCFFYLLAVIGASFSKLKLPFVSIPAGFVFLNVMSLSGLSHYFRGSYRQGCWPTTKPEQCTSGIRSQ